jgi:hypothetical protein
MKSFSKILESSDVEKNYQIDSEITLIIKAKNQGEASYLADSYLANTKAQSTFTIKKIEEISVMQESIDIDFSSIPMDLTPEDKILTAWSNTFSDRQPTESEKMEFYHQLRKIGFDGMIIMNALKTKI